MVAKIKYVLILLALMFNYKLHASSIDLHSIVGYRMYVMQRLCFCFDSLCRFCVKKR